MVRDIHTYIKSNMTEIEHSIKIKSSLTTLLKNNRDCLKKVFDKVFRYKNWGWIVYTCPANSTEEFIYKRLLHWWNFVDRGRNAKISPAIERERANARLREFTELSITPVEGAYLDYGAGAGHIARAIGNYLDMPTYAADINEWHGHQNLENLKKNDEKCTITNSNRRVEYGVITERDIIPTVFADQKFSLVTLFMVLHHVSQARREAIVEALAKCTTADATIVIREHDCRTETERQMCDVEHLAFGVLTYEPYADFIKNYHGDFLSIAYWTDLFERHGFKHVATSTPRKITRYTYIVFER